MAAISRLHLAASPRGLYAIDLQGMSEHDFEAKIPRTYSHLLNTVKSDREQNREAIRQKNWYLFARPNTELRQTLAGLTRYIATIRTAKHRVFQFLEGEVLPESRLVAVGISDALGL